MGPFAGGQLGGYFLAKPSKGDRESFANVNTSRGANPKVVAEVWVWE